MGLSSLIGASRLPLGRVQYPIVEVGPNGAVRRNWGPLTLAQAQALGTSVGLVVGDVAYITDYDVQAVCETATTTSTWSAKRRRSLHFAYGASDTAKRFVPVSSVTSAVAMNAGNYHAIRTAQHNGRIVGLTMWSSVATMATTIAGTHINTGDYPSTTAGDTDTQEVDTATVGVTFTFDEDLSAFSKGDLWAVSIHPQDGNCGNQSGEIEIEEDLLT